MSGTHCCDPKIISIKAIAETKGKFVIGQSGSLIIKITDSQGNPANPSSIEFSIRDSNNNVVIVKDIDGTTLTGESLRPDKVADGFFVYEWRLDDSLNADDYTITWSYIVDGTEYNVVDTVTVSNDGVYTELYNDKMVALRESLDYLLCCMQNVPIYNEQAKPSQDCKTYYFTRSNWKQNPAQTRIYRNGHTIIASGITIDYTNGKVIFDKKNSEVDWISADYSYRWFTDEALTDYIKGAIQMYNHTKPFSRYNFLTLPDSAIRGVLYKAASDAIRELLACLMMPEPEQLFGGPERANNIRSQLESLKKNYEEDWKYVFEQKQFKPYPGIMVVSTPEFTLPGGRSRWFRYLFSTNT